MRLGALSVEETEQGIRFDVADGASASVSTDEVPLLMGLLKRHLEDSANRRSSWRLTLNTLGGTDADKLEVRLHSGDHVIEARAVDISLTGMCVDIAEPVGERGDSVEVEVSFEGMLVTLVGTIVRQDGNMRRVALHFPECVDASGALTPPDAYRDVFTTLEQIWMDKKLGLVWN